MLVTQGDSTYSIAVHRLGYVIQCILEFLLLLVYYSIVDINLLFTLDH